MSDFTQILAQLDPADPSAADQLLPLIYEQLRSLAAAKLAEEKPGHTLQPTALVHEAYLRLVGTGQPQQWDSQGHFFAAAAEAMRRILVERARQKNSLKGGGARKRLSFDEADVHVPDREEELIALDEALAALEQHDPQAAALVKLRFFAGLSHQEAAAALGIGRRTADRRWVIGRAWLYARIKR